MNQQARGQVGATAAEVYESFFVPALFAQWTGQTLDAAEVGPGDRVLDVGCGTGILARAAKERVGARGSVVGIDPNEPMLTVARRIQPDVAWQTATAESIPHADASFQRVVSQFAAMFFVDRARAFREMRRVTSRGGKVAVVTWGALDANPGYSALVDLLDRMFGADVAAGVKAPFALGDPDELAGLLRQADLEGVRVEERQGLARFESIDAWIHTDIRGWTVADMINDDDYDRLGREARRHLAAFTDASGTVVFPAPALIATGVNR